MSETLTRNLSVESMQHRAFGKLICLKFGDEATIRLTPKEASSLSFALVAVRNGISPEREIYMSPIASDGAFEGAVNEAGMSISSGNHVIELDWDEVEALATALAQAIG